ncbi:hypothetical protein HOLleu_33216 [Holothuria leucospilota]|uniref:MHD2 domain-containing protein n=1 Tax=Holothuria leucospilota TaxID=206669 RepID=A0A9Q0YN94_HOLLE|nr:hypothetical protein HOLleu_33216 [Holothuria leucospilota]
MDVRRNLGVWETGKPTQVPPDRVFKPFFNNLKLNSVNFSLVWQAEEMSMPEGILANVEDYFRKYLASHRTTTVLQSPSTPTEDYSFPNIQNEGIDSGIEDAQDVKLSARPTLTCNESRLSDREHSLYKHALLCAQFPVLSREPFKPTSYPQPPSPFSLSSLAFSTPPLSPTILSRSYSSGGGNSSDEGENLVQEEMLCSLVREAFRLTEESHISYDRAITEAYGGKSPAKILVEELLGRLYLIENHNHPLYRQSAFYINGATGQQQASRLSSIAYDLWQQEERMLVGSFISQFWTGHLPSPNSHLCRPEYWQSMQLMYKELLIKLLRHDQHVDGATNHRVILHSSSRRLLKEFALRYGVSDVYQRLVFLEFLSEEENFELERGFLRTVLQSITRTRDLIIREDEQSYTLNSELNLALKVLQQLRLRCESKLQGMLHTSLSPQIVGSLLTILSDAMQLINDLGGKNQESTKDCIERCVKKCFDNWFYHHRLRLTTELHLNSYTTLVSAELISKLVTWIQNEVLNCQQKYFAIFQSHSVDINKVACYSLYKKLMVDVRKLYNYIQNDSGENQSYSESTTELVTLARKLDKLSQDWSHVITPSQETWRFLFVHLAHMWLKEIRKDLHRLIRHSVEQDEFQGMDAPMTAEGSKLNHQRVLQSSGNFSPSLGSAFRSVSPPQSAGRSLANTIQSLAEDVKDPFLVLGSQGVGPDSLRKVRGGPTYHQGIKQENKECSKENHLSRLEGANNFQGTSQVASQSKYFISYPTYSPDDAPHLGWDSSVDSEDSQDIVGTVGKEHGDQVPNSFNCSSGYGTISQMRPSVSSFSSSVLTSSASTPYTQSGAFDASHQEPITVVTAPFSQSVFDFLTMMSCTSQFLKELCVVLCPESRDFLADGNFDALRAVLEAQRIHCIVGRDEEQILDILMPFYAVSMLSIDLCATPVSDAKSMVSEKVLDFANEMLAYNCLPRCRHQRNNQSNCNVYMNRKDDYICDRFEPITPEMCVRINNVETLLTSRKWLFQDHPHVHPFLNRRGQGSDDDNMQTLLEEVHLAQIKILAYKECPKAGSGTPYLWGGLCHFVVPQGSLGECGLNPFPGAKSWLCACSQLNLGLSRSMAILLECDASGIYNNMQPFLSCLHNHLNALSDWLYPQSYNQFCQSLWEMIINDVSDTVKKVPLLTQRTERLAGKLMQFMAKLLKEFTQGPLGRLDTEQCLKLAQPLLKILELYTLPTATIILTYHKILAQNWSSGYLHSSSGFLTQELLDVLSSSLHQTRKCFTASNLYSALENFGREHGHSENSTREEWMAGVVNEMIERRLLHPVGKGMRGSSRSSAVRSTPSRLYSEESEEYIFPEVTVHTFSEAPSDYRETSSGSNSPPVQPSVPDVKTIVKTWSKAHVEQREMNEDSVETMETDAGEMRSGGENEAKRSTEDATEVNSQSEPRRDESQGERQEKSDDIGERKNDEHKKNEEEDKKEKLDDEKMKKVGGNDGGSSTFKEAPSEMGGTHDTSGMGGLASFSHDMNECNQPANVTSGDGNVVGGTHIREGGVGATGGVMVANEGDYKSEQFKSFIEEKDGDVKINDQPAVRPKQRNIKPAFQEVAEVPKLQNEDSDDAGMETSLGQKLVRHEEEREGSGETGSQDQSSFVFMGEDPASIFTELEERSSFYRLSLPLQMQTDGLHLSGPGEHVSNADILITILQSRRRYDSEARDFMRSFVRVSHWPFCFC